jgi:glycerol kinase
VTYLVAIDQGTTSTRAIVFDERGRPVATGQLEHRQSFPKPGWVEHDAAEIWHNTREVIGIALAKADITRHDVAGIGITNQRETAVVWNRKTGEPVAPAIVWQDTRTQKMVDELTQDGGTDRFAEITGLPLATYFSATKIAWILDNVDGARKSAEAEDLLFGTTDSWVLWNLTGGVDGGVHATDVTNASRTLLMDLRTLDWRDDLLKAFGIPRSMMPEIRPSSGVFGHAEASSLLREVPIAGILGDQQAATFGQAAFDAGESKNTYGTGNFLIVNTGETIVRSTNGLITTVAYQLDGQAPRYALEGSVAVSGSLVQWLRDNLGLSRFANKGHFARDALEATAFQTREVLDAVNADAGVAIDELRVDGGMVANDALMQFQADILGIPVVRPQVTETTALGAAYAAGLATGVWGSLDDLRANWHEDARFEPTFSDDDREQRMAQWRKAVSRSLDWVD